MEKYNFCFNCLPIRIFVLFLAITVEIMSSIGRSTFELQNSYHLTSFDLEDIDPRSWKLHQSEFTMGPPFPPNFVILAITGAEISGGGGVNRPPGRI